VEFASATGSTPNPYRFVGASGYITDPSGLQQLGARFYWPELGRFLQQDPIGDGMNWYAYAYNNPLIFIDPLGLCWTALDSVQLAFDAGGLIPVIGEPLDLVNAGISAARGNWDDAALSAVAVIPVVGLAGTAGKGAKRAGDVAGLVRRLSKGKVGLDLGGAAHGLSKRILVGSGLPGEAAEALAKNQKAIPHLNIGKYHVVVNRRNWYRPWKWFVG
jgi:RHS repeat-associated protein